jgi:opacity protein-like surface antigen
MKQSVCMGLLASVCFNSSLYAFNPVQGFYGSLLVEGSHGSSGFTVLIPHPNFPNPPLSIVGQINNGPIGGGGGAALGYRIRKFRLEAEFLYNYINSTSFNFNGCILQSPTVPGPIGVCPNNFNLVQIGFNGSTVAMFGLFNAYYDFLSSDPDTHFFPYLGIGFGAANIRQSVNFARSIGVITNPFSVGFTRSMSSGAAQGILGIGVYMDDYTWGGLDYRYVTTTSALRDLGSERYGIHTLNLSINFSFDKGIGCTRNC